jgi:hypothetical protein
MLIQSRASRISDVLTLKDVEEIAESPPGAVQDAVSRKIREELKEIASSPPSTLQTPATSQTVSNATKDRHATIEAGKVEFKDR